jgi:protein-S-isoprenylcysteine O-methyltransferase Ste14
VPLGVSLVAVAITLFSFSVAKFRAAGTPVPARKPTTVIIRTGPYRFSRNPIYLAFSVLQVGIAIWVNSLWLLATLGGALALINYVVIRREEAYLERRFGAEYFGLQGLCPSLAVSAQPAAGADRRHESDVTRPHMVVRRRFF